jgi:hypothetical protein
MEAVMAEDALAKLEREMGLATPETAQTAPAQKELGPLAGN